MPWKTLTFKSKSIVNVQHRKYIFFLQNLNKVFFFQLQRKMLLQEIWTEYTANENDPSFPSKKICQQTSSKSQEDSDTLCLGNNKWCKRWKCFPMTTPVESVCCQEINAVEVSIAEGEDFITQCDFFHDFCNNLENVKVQRISLHLEVPPPVDAENNRYR